MKRLLIVLLVVGLVSLTAFLIADWASKRGEVVNDNGIDWVDVTVQAGENPPPPEEVGADYIEPREPIGGVIEGNDLATFVERWNEEVNNLEKPWLLIEEVEVNYAMDFMSSIYEFADWLWIGTFICYDTGYIDGILVRWDITPDIDEEMITASWLAAIYATEPDMTFDEAFDVIDELGILYLTAEQLADYRLDTAIGDLRYGFISTDRWGDFMISPSGNN